MSNSFNQKPNKLNQKFNFFNFLVFGLMHILFDLMIRFEMYLYNELLYNQKRSENYRKWLGIERKRPGNTESGLKSICKKQYDKKMTMKRLGNDRKYKKRTKITGSRHKKTGMTRYGSRFDRTRTEISRKWTENIRKCPEFSGNAQKYWGN